MSLFQTVIFAIIQGITELFPISSVAPPELVTSQTVTYELSPEQFLKKHYAFQLHHSQYTVSALDRSLVRAHEYFWREK